MPTLISRSGNRCLNSLRFDDPTESLHDGDDAAVVLGQRDRACRRRRRGSRAPRHSLAFQLLQRRRELVVGRHAMMPLDAVLDERDAAALVRARDDAASASGRRPGARRRRRSAASTSWPSTSTTSQPNARQRSASGSSAIVCSVASPCCSPLRSTMTVRWSRPKCAAAMAASQLLPSCSSPSPVSTNVRHVGAVDLCRGGHTDGNRQAVAERPGVRLDARHFVAVRMAVERETAAACRCRGPSTGKNPRSASVAYSAADAWPLLRMKRSRSGSRGDSGRTPQHAEVERGEDVGAREVAARMAHARRVHHAQARPADAAGALQDADVTRLHKYAGYCFHASVR